jgi:hypothetical protein
MTEYVHGADLLLRLTVARIEPRGKLEGSKGTTVMPTFRQLHPLAQLSTHSIVGVSTQAQPHGAFYLHLYMCRI